MKYPIGIQNFDKIRKENYVYIDKTALVYQLASEGCYYFLSRPRRFGKSLLISTIEAYFQGKKELFGGLAIETLEQEWAKHPILHLDLNTEKYDSPEALAGKLNAQLTEWERTYGREESEVSPGLRFEGMIKRAAEKTGRSVVILVDEYDKPLLQAIGNEELKTEYRNMLKGFYGALKSRDAYIRFALLTGVSKFSKVSVFSDLNNLMDISMDARYAEICGMTEQEIRETFDDEVKALAAKEGLTKDECYDKLRENYDGYHFCPDSTGMYNPFSLLNTLSAKSFGNYWFETGTPTFLVERLKKTGYMLENLTQEEVTADVLNSIDAMDENPIPLIYQSGYLTIKGYDKEFGLYRMGFPNKEVELGFIRFLLPCYTAAASNRGAFNVANFVKDVRAGRPEQFMTRLATMFADGDYRIAGDAELYFHNAVYVIFKLMGFYVEVERALCDGRMDLVIKTDRYIYIMEFKLDRSADEAMSQIEEKHYAAPFMADGRKIYKIGVSFSSKSRSMAEWKIE